MYSCLWEAFSLRCISSINKNGIVTSVFNASQSATGLLKMQEKTLNSTSKQFYFFSSEFTTSRVLCLVLQKRLRKRLKYAVCVRSSTCQHAIDAPDCQHANHGL